MKPNQNGRNSHQPVSNVRSFSNVTNGSHNSNTFICGKRLRNRNPLSTMARILQAESSDSDLEKESSQSDNEYSSWSSIVANTRQMNSNKDNQQKKTFQTNRVQQTGTPNKKNKNDDDLGKRKSFKKKQNIARNGTHWSMKSKKFLNKQVLEDYGKYQSVIVLYRDQGYKQLSCPLYLTSTLSYMKYFQKEYDDNCNPSLRLEEKSKNEVNDDDENPSSNQIDDEEKEDDNNDNIVSTVLVLDPLALDPITGYQYATIDFYVIRRQGPDTMLDKDSVDDLKIYLGTSSIKFGDSSLLSNDTNCRQQQTSTSIINNRIIIPIKLLFELDQINSDQTDTVNDPSTFIYSSEDYKYFINAVVTYYRQNVDLERKFSMDFMLTRTTRSSMTSSIVSKSPIDDNQISIRSINSNPPNVLEFFFGFELENVQHIHYTKRLPPLDNLYSIGENQQNKRKRLSSIGASNNNCSNYPLLIRGEATHLLRKFDSNTKSSSIRPRNIVTELNKWNRITKMDVFYQNSRKNTRCDFLEFIDRLHNNGNIKSNSSNYYITFRLLRTNTNSISNEQPKKRLSSFSWGQKSSLTPNSAQESIFDQTTNIVNQFNQGQFVTKKKLIEARNLEEERCNKLTNCNDDSDSSDGPQQIVPRRSQRPQTRKSTLSTQNDTAVLNNRGNQQNSDSNLNHNDKATEEPEPMPSLVRLLHEKDGYNVIYNIANLQNNLIMEDFSCPFCSMWFSMLAQLAIHFHTNHDRFEFRISLDYDNRLVVVNVCFNDQFDPCVQHEALDERVLNFKAHQVGKPMARACSNNQHPYTMLYVNGYGLDHRSLFQYQEEDQQFQIDQRIVPYETISQRRVFYHSRTMMPILPAEMDEDSEDEEPKWIIKQKRLMLQDFIDVNPGEKAMMSLWNEYMMKNRTRYFANRHISTAVKDFMHQYTPKILSMNLYYNCLLHLCNLFRYELINQSAMFEAIDYINKMRHFYHQCMDVKHIHSLDGQPIPDKISEFLNYIQEKPPPPDNLKLETSDSDEYSESDIDDINMWKILGPESHVLNQEVVQGLLKMDRQIHHNGEDDETRFARICHEMEQFEMKDLLKTGKEYLRMKDTDKKNIEFPKR